MRRSEMKKTGFFKGMLDGLRSSVTQPVKSEAEVEENLRPDHFLVAKTVRHGFPFQPTAIGFDPVQRLLAIGTKSGSLRIFGRPGVDCCVQHILEYAVIQILFLTNEGALITVCSDDSLHLWNLRQKKPEIVHTLKFQKERITHCHMPFQSKWLYIGTERGNVHVVNIESFVLSGYVINWNKAIELSRKTHPGSVVHLSDNPVDPNKLLIGFETGIVVLWDLRSKIAEMRCQCPEMLKSVSWHHEGKQFMCSHSDGTLSTWNLKVPTKPFSIMNPHAKQTAEGKFEPCKPIYKVEWKTIRGGDSFVIFSGGLPFEKGGKTPSLTVIHGKTTTVLEMEHNIIDFVTLCETPWQSDFQEPYAIVVLLYNDLVVVDLTSTGFPCFQNPYPMDLHESPVTYCTYLADCPTDLIPVFYSVGCKSNKRTGFSENEWPINGGEWGTGTVSYPEIIITGHADGTLKFWDASSVSLQVLYKMKTGKVFEKPRGKSFDGHEDDPFAIEQVAFCPESRVLATAGASSQVVLFRFGKQETSAEVPVLQIPIVYEIDDDPDCSPECEYPPRPALGQSSQQGSFSSASEENSRKSASDLYIPLRVKPGLVKKAPGFQVELVCLTPWVNGEPPGHITSLSINSSYGLMAYGNECGLAVVDVVTKSCLLNIGTPDLYGSSDPYQRIPRSPKKNVTGNNENNNNNEQERCRSPTTDQPECLVGTLNQADTCSSCAQTAPIPPPRTRRKKKALNGNSHPSSHPQDSSSSTSTLNNVSPAEDVLEITWPKAVPSVDAKRRASRQSSRQDRAGSQSSRQDSQDSRGSSKSNRQESQDRRASNHSGCQDSAASSQSSNHESQDRRASCQESQDRHANNQSNRQESKDRRASNQFSRRESKDRRASNQSSRQESKDRLASNQSSRQESQDKRANNQSSRQDRRASCHSSRQESLDSREDLEDAEVDGRRRKSRLVKKGSRILMDLRDEQETCLLSPVVKMFNKIDSSFSRSRSSSMSSLENISSEAIQCLRFIDSYTRKVISPCLWVGTSLGSVLVVMLTVPGGVEARQSQPVMVSPSGTIFRLKGCILSMTFLDCNGALIPGLYEPWREANREEKRIRTPSGNPAPQRMRVSPTSSSDVRDMQFAVVTSEKQVRVISLPSQTCMFKQNITETSFVVQAEVVSIKGTDSVCLACYVGNGNIMVYSLPSLKLLCEMDFLPLVDIRIARTFCFSNNGHGMYLCSPSELQKFTISANFCENLQEMMGTLFLTKEMPEAPKLGFFKGLFGGGPSILDREELFGEASGKASKSVARHIPGTTANVEHLRSQSSTLASELSRARQGLTERGEHLTILEERTARMMSEAECFANASHGLMVKYRDKKWYQF